MEPEWSVENIDDVFSFANNDTDEEVDNEHCCDSEYDEPCDLDFSQMPVSSFSQGLRLWAVETKQSHRSINSLLALLSKTTSLVLPKDATTLFHTPHNPAAAEITQVSGGQLWYQGIAKSLQHYFSKLTPKVTKFELDFSMDGLPLFKSSSTQLWPILMRAYRMPKVPVMVVAVYCADSKPQSVEEYLREFVTELNDLLKNGILINGCMIAVTTRAVIASAPARAFLKGVVSFNAAHGCLKCTSVAKKDSLTRRMYFDGVGATKRTDQLFKANAYPLHCKCSTPLTDLEQFDVIKDVIVGDSLHLIDFGIMRKLMDGWMCGNFGRHTKWSAEQCHQITNFLMDMQLPSEIRQKMRSLKCIASWKATEFRSFLYYASVPVLKDKLSTDRYNHFMLLYCAITFLSSPIYKKYWQFAGQLLDKFVVDFKQVYDISLVSSHVHNLQHVFEDVKRFGHLSTISSYPFQNDLQRIKHLVRHGCKSLEQVVNHFMEYKFINIAEGNIDPTFPMVKKRGNEVIAHITPDFFLKRDSRNQWFMLKDFTVIRYHTAVQTASDFSCYGEQFLRQRESFSYPCSSYHMNIVTGDLDDITDSCIKISVSDIRCKLSAVKLGTNTLMFTPLINTLME